MKSNNLSIAKKLGIDRVSAGPIHHDQRVPTRFAKDVVDANQVLKQMTDGWVQVKTSVGELSKLLESLKQVVAQIKI